MDNGGAKAVIHSAGYGLFIGISPSGHAQVIETNHERDSAATPMEIFRSLFCTEPDTDVRVAYKRGDSPRDPRARG